MTTIAVDERPIESMRAIRDLLRDVDREWKIALCTDHYEPELADDVYDYSIASYLKGHGIQSFDFYSFKC